MDLFVAGAVEISFQVQICALVLTYVLSLHSHTLALIFCYVCSHMCSHMSSHALLNLLLSFVRAPIVYSCVPSYVRRS